MMDLFIINSDGEISELLNIFKKGDEPPVKQAGTSSFRLNKNKKLLSKV